MAVRLFVGNMPYGATEADLRAHFSGVGAAVSNRHSRSTAKPAGRAGSRSSSSSTARMAEQAIKRFNQQPFMGRSLSVSEARPREAGGAGGGFRPERPGRRRWLRRPAPGRAAASAARGRAAASAAAAGGGGFRPGPAGRRRRAGTRTSARPKKKSASSEKRWESKERGPKGPIKERYTGRLGGLYDDPNDDQRRRSTDFDDPASRAPEDDDEVATEQEVATMATHVKVIARSLPRRRRSCWSAWRSSRLLLRLLAGLVGASEEEGAAVGAAVLGLTGAALSDRPARLLAVPFVAAGWGLLKFQPLGAHPRHRPRRDRPDAVPVGTAVRNLCAGILFRKDTEALFAEREPLLT